MDQAAVADYIRTMSAELGAMAGEAGLDLLAYLLDMARLEASAAGRRLNGIDAPEGEPG